MNGQTADQKLDTVLTEIRSVKSILHGEEDRPGLMHDVAALKHTLYGHSADMGDHHRTAVMWRVHIWLLCSGSAALGGVLTLAVRWAIATLKL